MFKFVILSGTSEYTGFLFCFEYCEPRSPYFLDPTTGILEQASTSLLRESMTMGEVADYLSVDSRYLHPGHGVNETSTPFLDKRKLLLDFLT